MKVLNVFLYGGEREYACLHVEWFESVRFVSCYVWLLQDSIYFGCVVSAALPLRHDAQAMVCLFSWELEELYSQHPN